MHRLQYAIRFGFRIVYPNEGMKIRALDVSRWVLGALAFVLVQVSLRTKDEASLARRLRDRDPHVMGVLYDRFGRLVYAVIFRIVRNAATAEDLVQETFLRVWNRGLSFDAERGALGPWILTVARNRAIDHLRSTEGRLSAGALELEYLESPGQ